MFLLISIYLVLGLLHAIGGLRLLHEKQPRRYNNICFGGKVILFVVVTLLWPIPAAKSLKKLAFGK